jgi:sucrose-6-phosphate hydrolase SacC (GH32 family)
VKTIQIFILAFLAAFSSIAQVGKELYRPIFHYSPGFNWMNDPNGLVYYNGKYHLFYQYNPLGTQPTNISWGHAVSTDLVFWEEKPVAIPTQNGIMIYSGSVVVDWKNTSGFGINGKPPLVALYTGANISTGIQDQRIAYSNDEGNTWTNYTQNPVITLNNKQFRDPKVIWHEETQKWIMVVSQGSYQGIRFYNSTNLKNWTSMAGFGSYGNRSGFWECPDFFRLAPDNDSSKMKWVLMHSVSPTAQYFVGDFNGERFSWAATSPDGILIDDFESENYNTWTVSGDAFGSSSTSSVSFGNLGSRLSNSSSLGNGAQGKLVSTDFTISKNYLGFLIGGGYHPGTAYIKLVVNGETVRASTGSNDNLLKWKNWDISDLQGQKAHIEIVDSVTGTWGHIKIDHIIQSDVMVDNINYGQVDYGKDFYAAQSFSDMPDGRRVWVAWLNNWNYAAQAPTSPWKGIMSIPREVKLETHNGRVALVQKPIEELKALRKNNLSFRNASIAAIDDALRSRIDNSIFKQTYKQFEIKAKIAVTNQSGFSLIFKKRGLQYTEFVFDFINKEIRFDRSKSGALTGDAYFKSMQVAPLIINDGYIDFQLFVDNCSAELFSGGGQIVMSNQIFPDSTSNQIELNSLDGDIIFEEFDIWNLGKSTALPYLMPDKYPLFRFYPNPIVNGNGLTIKIRDEIVGQVVFKIFNASGKLVSEFQPSSNSLILPRNKIPLSKGLYYIMASDRITTQTEKLVVVGD